ncbi:hypothetical protein PUR61_16630, partial [Streptomyces sp. BE20]|nr:hypothetical protein [Streptomyces sp. BE20]
TQRNTSVPVPGVSGVVGIASGSAHNLAVLSDGTVQAWGLHDKGQLGDGTTPRRRAPVRVVALLVVAPGFHGAVHQLGHD